MSHSPLSHSPSVLLRRPLTLERPLLLLLALLLAAFTLPLISAPARAADGDTPIPSTGTPGAKGTISGRAFVDLVQGAGSFFTDSGVASDPGVAGVPVYAYWIGEDGAVSPTYSTTTGADGTWAIDFKPWTDAAGTVHTFKASVWDAAAPYEQVKLWAGPAPDPSVQLVYADGLFQPADSNMRRSAFWNDINDTITTANLVFQKVTNPALHEPLAAQSPSATGTNWGVSGSVFVDNFETTGYLNFPFDDAQDPGVGGVKVTASIRNKATGEIITRTTTTKPDGTYFIGFSEMNLLSSWLDWQTYVSITPPSGTASASLWSTPEFRNYDSSLMNVNGAGVYNGATYSGIRFTLVSLPKMQITVPGQAPTAAVGTTLGTNTTQLVPGVADTYTITWRDQAGAVLGTCDALAVSAAGTVGSCPLPVTAAMDGQTLTATLTNSAGSVISVDSVLVASPKLSLTKTAPDGGFIEGQPADYTFTVNNDATASAAASSATFTDTLPAGLQFVGPKDPDGAAPAAPGTCVASGQKVTCTVAGPIAVGGSKTFAMKVVAVNATAATVDNHATVDTAGGSAPADPSTCTGANPPAGCASATGTPVTQFTVTEENADGTLGVPYADPVAPTMNGGTGPFTFEVTTGSLPAGLSIDPVTGEITGTPTKAGDYTFTVTVTDSFGNTDTYTDTIKIALPALVVNPGGSLPDGTVDSPYVGPAPTTTGGDGDYTYSSPDLPPGLTINPDTGVISGTPTTPGTYDITVVVTDGAGDTGSFTQTVVIKPAPLTASGLISDGFVGAPFTSDAPSVAGGTGPYTFASTKLPAGLTIDPATGVISGTPTQGGTFTVTVTVTSKDGQTTTYTDTFVIDTGAVEVIANTDLPNGQVGDAYTAPAPVVTGGTGPYTFAVTDGTLPPGTAIDPATGAISGTPTTAGDYPVTITVTDKDGKTTTITDTIVILPAPVTITGGMTLPDGKLGDAYTGPAPVVTGGAGGNTFSSTTLPDGLTIDPKTGVISGTPKAEGTYTITVTVTDKNGVSDSFADTIVIGSDPLAITSGADLPNGTVETPYNSAAPGVAGGTGPYTFNPGDTLPPGLTMDPNTGAISGTPTEAGDFTVTVTVTDANGKTTTYTDTVIIGYPAVVIDAWQEATATDGVPFTGATPTATGGDGSFTWSSTQLPAGLTLDPATGIVSGIPTEPGTHTWTLTADDGNGNTDSVSQTLVVNAPFVIVNPSDLPDGKVGDPYSYTPEVLNPFPPGDPASMGDCVTDETKLPPGLKWDAAACSITGVPTQAGDYPVTIEVVNGPDGMTATVTDTIVISPADLVLKSDPLPDGKEGDPYAGPAPTTTGGSGGNVYSSTTLPEGLTIDPKTGVIAGTPTEAGTFTVTITVTDDKGATATFEDTFVIAGDPITVTAGADLPDGKVGDNYSSPAPKVEGGTGPFTFADNGSLPPGLKIDPNTGVITGSPTVEGTFVVTIQVKDAAGHTTSYTDTVVIAPLSPPVVIVGGPTLPNGTVGGDYSTPPPAVKGGDGTYVWSAEGLPPGLSIDPKTGAVTGKPTAEGTYQVVTTVKDGHGNSETFTDIVVIGAGQAAGVPSLDVKLPGGTVGKKYVGGKPSLVVPGCDNLAPRLARAVKCTVAYSAKGLPKGLTINAKTGVVTGIPKVKGTFTVKVTAKVSNGLVVTDTVKVTIKGAGGAGTPGGGTKGHAPKGHYLPSTGSGVEPWMIVVGMGLIAAGALLMRLTRRRS